MVQKIKELVINTANSVWTRIKRVLICIDQLINVLVFNGYEDETLSARFHRWSKKDRFLWMLPSVVVDTVFFFDYFYEGTKKIKHCEKSFIREANRHGFPDDYKTKE